MKYLKLYALLVSALTLGIAVFGFAGPGLISAKNTELVLAGWALVWIAIPLLAYIVMLAIREIFKLIEEGSNEGN